MIIVVCGVMVLCDSDVIFDIVVGLGWLWCGIVLFVVVL